MMDALIESGWIWKTGVSCIMMILDNCVATENMYNIVGARPENLETVICEMVSKKVENWENTRRNHQLVDIEQ